MVNPNISLFSMIIPYPVSRRILGHNLFVSNNEDGHGISSSEFWIVSIIAGSFLFISISSTIFWILNLLQGQTSYLNFNHFGPSNQLDSFSSFIVQIPLVSRSAGLSVVSQWPNSISIDLSANSRAVALISNVRFWMKTSCLSFFRIQLSAIVASDKIVIRFQITCISELTNFAILDASKIANNSPLGTVIFFWLDFFVGINLCLASISEILIPFRVLVIRYATAP